MSIKYYANRVQETTVSTGAGNLVLSGAPLGYRTFVAGIGANNKLTYYVYRQDTNFEWEIGVGYVTSTGGINQLVREKVVASSNGNSIVGFTSGTKYIETILSEDRANTSFINVEEKGANFSPPYIPVTYIVDASTTGVQVSLPAVSAQTDPIILGFLLNKTVGNVYEQANAIQLIPNGTETIAGTTGIDVSILNDYLQIVSVPSQSGWLLLDPIQDSTNPYGNDGSVQFKSNGAFSGVNEFVWDSSTDQLLIGDSGVATADILLPSSSGQTTIFNQNLYDNDLRVAGSGISHLLFVDGGLGRVGVNTSSVSDTLNINAGTGSGITVSKSGTGPSILLNNTSISGITSNDIIGSVTFDGLNNSGTVVRYGSINNIVESNVDGSEFSNFTIETLNNGSIEEIAVLSPSGITLGSNTQNIDGIVLGAGSNNEGNNVVAGYFNNVCGENCVVLGDNASVASGTFGGVIGSNHSVSGNNIWVLGGSGIVASGSNQTIVALDSDNYIEIGQSGLFKYSTLSDDDIVFGIENTSVLISGVDQSIAFTFYNNSGVLKSGLVITSSISDVTNSSEDSSYVARILSGGSSVKVLDLNATNLSVGPNTSSGNNIIFGLNNTIGNSNNIVYGSDIVATGTDNILIGNNINLLASGTGITVIGQNNDCLSSGNLGVVILGNGNQANEDYSIAIGTDNANSGLYSVSCGYLNGAHGDYVVSVGEGNLVQSNYSVAIGRNNNLGSTDLAASLLVLGVGNSGNISNTGIIVGYLNQLSGSGSIVIGKNCAVSGNNNIVFGNSIGFSGTDTVLISGVSTKILGNTVNISGVTSTTINGATISISGTNPVMYGSSTATVQSANNHRFVVSPTAASIYGPTGIYVSGQVVDIYGSGLTMTATGDIELTTNASNQLNVWTTGIDILGSEVNILADANNKIVVESTGIDILSNARIKSYIDSNNYIEIDNTNAHIKGSTVTAGYDSSHELFISPSFSYLKDTSNIYIEVDPNKRLHVSTGETTISSDVLVKTYFNTNTKTELQSSGYDISAMSGVRINTDANYGGNLFNLAKFDIDGVTINNYESSVWWSPLYTNTVINKTGIYIYNDVGAGPFSNPVTIVFASGMAGFKQPNPMYTVDVSGEFRLSNTGVGLIYENYPSATGVGRNIVIEDNIIKAGDGGVNIASFVSSSITLYSIDKKTQLLDPNSTGTYTLTLDTANMTEGREFRIRNTSNNPNSEQIDVVDGYSSSTIATLGGSPGADLSCIVVFDGTQWRLLMSGN